MYGSALQARRHRPPDDYQIKASHVAIVDDKKVIKRLSLVFEGHFFYTEIFSLKNEGKLFRFEK